MNKTKKIYKKIKGGTKKNKERKYYPNRLIGMGGYKSVYDLIPETEKHKITDDSLTMEEREVMSLNIKGKKHMNMVLITPNEKEITKEDIKDFNKEFTLQEKFSEKKLAPKVLVKKLKKYNDTYKLFALTYRCNFNICDYDYSKIENKLKKLFDEVSKEGYIYTDIKKGNLCEFNLLHKGKLKSNHFVFVDFDEKFIYKYDGFNTSFTDIPKQEIISDIMEFMFLTIELFQCGYNLNCKFCKNTENVKNKINKIIKKYENQDLPMITNEYKATLLHLIGANIPFMTPLAMNNFYLSNSNDANNHEKLYDIIQNLLNDEIPLKESPILLSPSTKSSELGQLIIKPSPSTKSSELGQLIIKPSPSTKSSAIISPPSLLKKTDILPKPPSPSELFMPDLSPKQRKITSYYPPKPPSPSKLPSPSVFLISHINKSKTPLTKRLSQLNVPNRKTKKRNLSINSIERRLNKLRN